MRSVDPTTETVLPVEEAARMSAAPSCRAMKLGGQRSHRMRAPGWSAATIGRIISTPLST